MITIYREEPLLALKSTSENYWCANGVIDPHHHYYFVVVVVVVVVCLFCFDGMPQRVMKVSFSVAIVGLSCSNMVGSAVSSNDTSHQPIVVIS